MVPFDKQTVTVVRQNKVGIDVTYEPPCGWDSASATRPSSLPMR